MMSPEQFLTLHEKLFGLKHLKRTGWVRCGVKDPESVGAHTMRMAVMAMFHKNEIEAYGADLNATVRKILYHDLIEAIAGDNISAHSPLAKLTAEQKEAKERAAAKELSKLLQDVERYFEEYESKATKEDKLVKGFDVSDMLNEAFENLVKEPDIKTLLQFMEFNKKSVLELNIPFLSEMTEDLNTLQDDFLADRVYSDVKNRRAIRFYQEVGKLKHMPRTGWVICGINDPESIADHSFGAAVMALSLKDEIEADGGNTDRIVQMMLIHDLAESRIGDIVPEQWQTDKISKETKIEMERKAVHKIAELYNFPEFAELWEEFETGKTRDAQIANDMDRLDMVFLAQLYHEKQPKAPYMETYYARHHSKMERPFTKKIMDAIGKRQAEYLKKINYFGQTQDSQRT